MANRRAIPGVFQEMRDRFQVTSSVLVAALLVGGMLGACQRAQAPDQSRSAEEVDTTSSSTTPEVGTTHVPGDVGSVGLFPVDALTLEPLPDLDPMTTGDWLTGRSSPNGEWLVLTVWIDTEPDTDIVRVLHIPSGRIVTEIETNRPFLHKIEVTDDGTVYHFGNRLLQLSKGAQRFQPAAAEIPAGFHLWEMTMLSQGRLGLLGTVGKELLPTLLLADLGAGTTTEVPLPDLAIGDVSEIELGDGVVMESVHPTAVWDPDRDRALVIHADRPRVTEVELSSGRTRVRDWSAPTSWLDAVVALMVPPAAAKGNAARTTVSGALGPEGRLLFIASASAEMVADAQGSWSVVPQGVNVIDTRSWQPVARFDLPVSIISISPNGRFAVGSGVTLTETLSTSMEDPKGVFIIDIATMHVVGHIESPGTWHPNIQFSPDGAFGYISLDRGGLIHVVDLASARVLKTVTGPEQLTIFGEAGLLSTRP